MKINFFSSYWFRSAVYSISQRFSITLFGLINYMILIRHLTQPQMGVYGLFLIVITVFETTKSALLKGAHIRFMSGSEDQAEKTRIASSSFLVNSLISVLFMSAILVFSHQLSDLLHTGPELSAMLRWFIPGLVSMVIFSHLEATQQSHLDFKGVFAGYFTRQVLFFLIIIVQGIMRIPFTLQGVAMDLSVSVVVGTVVLYFFTRKYLRHQWSYNAGWTKRLLGFGGYIFGSGVASNIFLNLDQLMTAALLKSTALVADYNAASRVNQFIDMPSYAAAEILFPKTSQASAKEDNEKVKYLFERMVAALFCFTVPTALLIIIFARIVIRVIAGPVYMSAAPILQLYMISGILRPAQNQAANLLNSIGKPRLSFAVNVVYLVMNLGINYICLISIGFYGAAIGSVITFSIGSVIWYFVMKKEIGFALKGVFQYMAAFGRTGYGYAVKLMSR